MAIIYATADYNNGNVNLAPAPQLGLAKIALPAVLTFAKVQNNTGFTGIGNGLGARQILGMSGLHPCPPKDCRNDPDCFKIPVFGGGTTNAGDNDYSTFMLEYPYVGSAPPWFDPGTSRWILRKDIAGTYEEQEQFAVTSTVAEFINYADLTNHFIYFNVKIFWDKVLSVYGAGDYDIIVYSVIAGENATQCSEIFKLTSLCCTEIAVVPPPVNTCQYGVQNSEFEDDSAWTYGAYSGASYDIHDGYADVWFDYMGDVGDYMEILGFTCDDIVDNVLYEVFIDVEIEGAMNVQIFLGTGAGTIITATGSYTQNILSAGTSPLKIVVTKTAPTNGITDYAHINYLRIPSLSAPPRSYTRLYQYC